MPDFKTSNDLLFVNGVNTHYGGSVKGAINVWKKSLNDENITHSFFDVVPNLKFKNKNYLYLCLLAIYFFPGTFFRIFNLPIFEFLYKVSPFLIFSFLSVKRKFKSSKIIFSHHSIFFLAIFSNKRQRIFLIQDLLYIRAKSRGASKRIQRIYFSIELFIYKYSSVLFVISYHEQRILKRFLDSEINLISSWSTYSMVNEPRYFPSKVAVISDWRRPENIHGALKYFNEGTNSLRFKEIAFKFYGFESNVIMKQIKSINRNSNISILDGGTFTDLSNIEEGFFFVPIYQGAGIKLKTIEGIALNRVVIGTKAAFIGLPPWIIREVIKVTKSLDDFPLDLVSPPVASFRDALDGLSLLFIPIGKAPCFHN